MKNKTLPFYSDLQLLEVILDRVWIDYDAHSHQGVECKVKYLVAEEGDDPGGMQLNQETIDV